MKQGYRGAFQYRKQVHILRAYAYSERQAWLVMCRRLAKVHDVDPRLVMSLFDGSQDNYSIELEVEVTEG